jgi:hypothetical protein
LRSQWYQSGIRASDSYSLTVSPMARPRDLRSHNPPTRDSRCCHSDRRSFLLRGVDFEGVKLLADEGKKLHGIPHPCPPALPPSQSALVGTSPADPAAPPQGRRPSGSNRTPRAAPFCLPSCWRPFPRRPARIRPPRARRAAARASGSASTPWRIPPSHVHCPKNLTASTNRDFAIGTSFRDTPTKFRDAITGQSCSVPLTSGCETFNLRVLLCLRCHRPSLGPSARRFTVRAASVSSPFPSRRVCRSGHRPRCPRKCAHYPPARRDVTRR